MREVRVLRTCKELEVSPFCLAFGVVIRGPTPSEHPRAQPARPRKEYRDDDDDDDFITTSVRLQYYTLRADPPVTTDFG